MIRKVKEAIELHGINTLAVAVSGGADSVALLDIMLKLRDEYGFEVIAAHFNHKLRGEESDRDQEFVKSLCNKQCVKLFCGEGDVLSFAKEQKFSTELAARKMRYDFFETLPANAVATAHTASDNLETVIFNLVRGSGIGGICGIPPRRGKYIRPLIFCTREEIEKYCSENKLQYVTDSTNLSDDYSRNKIRHNIVPLLKELNPAVENNVTNTSLLLSYDRDALNNFAKSEYNRRISKDGLSVKNIADLGPAVCSRVLRLFCKKKTGVEPDYRHTQDLFNVAVNGGRCSLENGFEAIRQKSILKIISFNNTPKFSVRITKIKNDKKINSLLSKNLIDCDKIVGELKVRTREPGDKIKLSGRGVTKTLKSLFNEKSISLNNRKVLPVISDDLGVVWVCNFGVAERVAVQCDSEFIFKISYEIISGGNNTK